ncbi:hypothetical protein HMPREF1529_02351 [Microbacterium sp. oral taxon 186 str. F0373]|uniref:Uncharacterized protein n=1 Tax=Microbacterium hominis TaxID=162426 RepID=A0A2K9DJA6_9MICO|nr:hypothetical protein CXR34_09025 [Microbacterium hominis]EPD84286.1 hypothetical protein HMPREF1529_02351 [Microbacterium sp. oral taxon 186 str. F0373]
MTDEPWRRVHQCSADACVATIADERWAMTKSDWFFQRNGAAFCPDHLPEWVPEWRARRGFSRLAENS